MKKTSISSCALTWKLLSLKWLDFSVKSYTHISEKMFSHCSYSFFVIILMIIICVHFCIHQIFTLLLVYLLLLHNYDRVVSIEFPLFIFNSYIHPWVKKKQKQNEIWGFRKRTEALKQHSNQNKKKIILNFNCLMFLFETIFADKLAVQKETYNAICADMDTTFAEMAGF